MTHMSDVTNGGSLEDCHTNFFALADLCGIKWKKLSAINSPCFDPLEDPVLLSYSKCLSAGILCVWRRIILQRPSYHQPGSVNDVQHLPHCKELWIFWYGEEPDLTGLVEPNLDTELGSWESGLSYECRTLLFKALHNSIERCLLSKGFARLSHFFIKPRLPLKDASRSQIAFAFNFFVHGESTVCMGVDMRVAPSVYHIRKNHLASAQSGANVKVILSPYGMEGTLTGHGYRMNNVEIAKLVNDWHRFYPRPLRSRRSTEDSNEMPAVVEVLVAGVRLKYPTAYVLIVEDFDPVPAGANHGRNYPNASSSYASSCSSGAKQCPSLSILTPPMSPEENTEHIDNVYKSKSVGAKTVLSQSYCASCRYEKSVLPQSIVKLSAMEEMCIFHQQSTEGTEESSYSWEVQDPSTVLQCSCSRKSFCPSSSKLHPPEFGAVASGSTYRKSEKVQNSLKSMPFHKRVGNFEKVVDNVAPKLSFPANGQAPATSYVSQAKNMNAAAPSSGPAGFISLPQLHTPLTQPSSVDSHSNVPSVETSCSQICSSDPIMPTLSPHPPALKEEDATPISESHEISFTHSPDVDIGPTINIKEKTSPDELMMHLHASLLNDFENAKGGSESPVNGKPLLDAVKEESPSFDMESKLQTCPLLKRPLLKEQFNFEEDDLTMKGSFYSYSEPTTFNDFIFAKRKCVRSYSFDNNQEEHCDIKSEHVMDSTCVPSFTADDPYEFREFDDTSPSEVFRQHSDIHIKEEEKAASPYTPSSPEVVSHVLPSPILPILQEKNIKICDLPIPTPSPPNPKNMHSKFIREEDLVVTPNDLDNIFDTSSSDSDDEFSSTTGNFPGAIDDPSGKCKPSNLPSGLLELSRMFPTPPSLEQNAAASPLGATGGMENASSDENGKDRELSEIFSSFYNFDPKDPDAVWKMNQLQMIVESSKYAPLTNLPSQLNSITLTEEMRYKPSGWLTRQQMFTPQNTYLEPQITPEMQMGFNHPNRCISFEEEQSFSSKYTLEQNMEQRFVLMTSNMQSPMGQLPPYINRHINSVEDIQMIPTYPEAHSLYVNLILSDSMLNIFKDHNFDSCSLCVCNMNIKGSDVGINLPYCLLPFRNDEPQYKCTCGFSAITYRHRSYCSGMFKEDEFDILGFRMEDIVPLRNGIEALGNSSRKTQFPCLDQVPPPSLLNLIQVQCKTLCSAFSLFHKPDLCSHLDLPLQMNALEVHDRCEVCFLALEVGRNMIDNVVNVKLDGNLKSTCLHKWPYLSYPLPSTSQEIMQMMNLLKPMLQEAVHKRNTQRLWEVTYVISGPLTWKEFHSLATTRGNEHQCEPQPIPSVTVGHNKDLLSLSPFALKYWDKLLLEPYSLPRDVAYIVVSPDNDFILSCVKSFFRELTSIYELYRMGRHSPIRKVLRDGILRVGQKAAQKLANEPVDDWFNKIGDNVVSSKLKLYAQVCQHHLAPYLSTLTLDKSVTESNIPKTPEKSYGTANSPKPPTPVDINDKVSKSSEQESANDNATSSATTSNPSEANDTEDTEPPALVIYIVEPFTFGSLDPDLYRLATLGLLQCYSQMLRFLPDNIRNSISLQLLSLNLILCMDGCDEVKKTDELKALAFSVFSQCHRILPHQLSVKSLTGFGPAAAQDLFLTNRINEGKMFSPLKIFNQPLILACQKDKQTELGEMFGDRQVKFGILYCSYCLTEDRRWLIAGCTDDKGEMTETIVINIATPNRLKKKCSAVRRLGLRKLMDFILNVLSISTTPWRIIIGRLGRLGHGELRDWAGLLSRKSLLTYSQHLREMCKQCAGLGSADTPSILSACLISVEPDSVLRVMPNQFNVQTRMKSGSYQMCNLSTPEDASCTHILVFPTSATMQSSQASLHQDPNDETNIFGELIEEEMNDPEFNDLLQWTDIPSQIQSTSPHHHSVSQPASPSANSCHSPFHPGGPSQGMAVPLESQDDTLPLLQQPLALGYYVSTAKAGPLPKWFWSSCPHLANCSPVFLKFALLIHLPSIHSPDDILHTNAPQHNGHPLDSPFTTDVLRYVLEGYNALSWLSLDPNSYDRKSCLPVHIQILMQLYKFVENLL